MPLIKCIDCSKEISDRAEICPHCGCPVSVSIAEQKKAEEESRKPLPLAPVEFDPIAVKLRFYDLIAPLMADSSKTREINSALFDELDKYESAVSENGISILKQRFESIFDRIRSSNSYRREQERFNMEVRMRVYDKIMNKPYEGPGFSIITNDALSMAAYAAMTAHDAKVFYQKQSRAADEIMDKLQTQNMSDTGIFESDFTELRSEADFAAFALGCMANARNALSKHLDLYENLGSIENNEVMQSHHEVFEALKEAYAGADFVRLVKDKYTRDEKGHLVTVKDDKLINLLAKAEQDGYVFYQKDIGRLWYFTTGKLEEDIRREEYLKAHPEERIKEASEKDIKKNSLQKAAEEAEAAGKYYRAATLYGKLDTPEEYKKSTDLWNKHILNKSFLQKAYGTAGGEDGFFIYAITDKGTVLTYPKSQHYQRAVQTNELCQTIMSFDDIIALSEGDSRGFAAVTCHGSARYSFIKVDNGRRVPCTGLFPPNETPWNNIKQLLVEGKCNCKTVVALFNDGTVASRNLDGSTNAFSTLVNSWSDIKQIAICSNYNVGATHIVGLTYNGQVLVAAANKDDVNLSVCKSWTDVDILIAFPGEILAIKHNGTVVSSDEDNQPIVSEWRNIIRICYDGSLRPVNGITSNGECCFDDEFDENAEKKKYWTKIVDIVGYIDTVCALQADGTVICSDPTHPFNGIENVVSLYVLGSYFFCVRCDGSVLCENYERGTDPEHIADIVRGWKLFDDIDSVNANLSEVAKTHAEKAKIEIKQQISKLNDQIQDLRNRADASKGFFGKSKADKLRNEAVLLETQRDTLIAQLDKT